MLQNSVTESGGIGELVLTPGLAHAPPWSLSCTEMGLVQADTSLMFKLRCLLSPYQQLPFGPP